MSDSSKPKRAYNSTRRQAQARQTRQQITHAARKLFSQYGYAGATIEGIAQEAGVAPETIYAVFGSKRKILAHLLALAVGGDDQPIPLLERPGPQAVFQEKDQARQLRMFAYDIPSILERVSPIYEIMRIAAKTEPEIAELVQNMLRDRLVNMQKTAERFGVNGPFREGLDQMQAADIIWTLTSPEIFRLLTGDRGWSKETYSEWLADSLIRLLLP